MTGQPIPIIMRILVLIKTNDPDQSKAKHYTQWKWFFSKTSWKMPIVFKKCLVQPWSSHSSSDFQKCPRMTRVTGMTRMTRVTRMTGMTKTTRVTGLTRMTRVTRMTRMTRMTRVTGLTRMTRITGVTRMTWMTM